MKDSTKRQILKKASVVLLTVDGWVLRGIYLLLYGWGRYRLFRLVQVSLEAMLARELPVLARFLLDCQIPEHCQSADPRFGVSCYLEESLVISAEEALDGLARKQGHKIE